MIPGVDVEKIDLGTEESSVFITHPKERELTWQDIFGAEEFSNRIIKENRKISIHLVDRDEARKRFPDARIKFDRIKSDTIRIIEIDNHDYSACAGVHCITTAFIGSIIATKFNKIQDRYEIRFKVNSNDEIMRLSRYAREAASALKISTPELVDFCRALQKEKDELKEKLRDSLLNKKIELKKEHAKNTVIRYSDCEGMDRKQITDKINELFAEEEGKQALVLFNCSEKGTQFTMRISEELGDVSEMIKALKIKGGGRGSFASGMCENKEEFVKKIKTFFEKN
jgi:alanyl-tRNA synthetase